MPVSNYLILGLLLLAAGLVFMLRRLLKTARVEVFAEYPEHVRILTSPMANFFGIQSRGMRQIRGNGILLLTASQIYFRMLLPGRELHVPLRSITSVETPNSFLGRTRGSKLLKVDFRNDTGGTDSVAWLVPDLEKWVEAIRGSAELN
ncbi:MAG: hypothetical protein KAR44_10860 [Candidatus Aegiribacteria sp.]|nr:hypothetical protein [Candidatus Aegiribacteria sp.]